MATYVFSDVHGHAAPLERLFNRVSPADDDRIVMLGDMIDRGPDPLGVMRFCKRLSDAGATILMGNHEELMLAYLDHRESSDAYANWVINGAVTTMEGLGTLDEHEFIDLIDWIKWLPLAAQTRVAGQLYLFTHAGLNPAKIDPALVAEKTTDEERIAAVLKRQTKEDLVWIREEFWGAPTGLIGPDGEGIIVVSGHTPTPYLDGMADRPDRSGCDEQGLGQMVRVGACEETGNVADRWDIDAGCAGGHGYGRLLLLRLDDGQEFYEDIDEDE